MKIINCSLCSVCKLNNRKKSLLKKHWPLVKSYAYNKITGFEFYIYLCQFTSGHIVLQRYFNKVKLVWTAVNFEDMNLIELSYPRGFK